MLKLKLQYLATWGEELTHWKRPWCWERLKVGGEEDNRGWDGWIASLTQWTWVWVGSESWWWTGKPCVLQSMGSPKVRHDWGTKLNWTDITVNYKHNAIQQISRASSPGLTETSYPLNSNSHFSLPASPRNCTFYLHKFNNFRYISLIVQYLSFCDWFIF